MKRLVFAVVLSCCSVTPVVAGELALEADFPTVGEDQAVTFTGMAQDQHPRLWVVYSPNSETRSEEEVGAFSPAGEIVWRPSRPGIATLTARDDEGATLAAENTAILFARTPATGVLVMIFAGVLLFGGAGFSLRSVLRSGELPQQSKRIDT